MSRLALFMPSLAGGGAERVMLTLAQAFVHRGLEVDLVVVTASGALSDAVPEGVETIDLGAGRLALSVAPLARYLRRRRPDALLSAMTPSNIVAVAARRLARVPLRLVISEHTPLAVSSGREHDVRLRVLPALARLSYGGADGIVAVSRGVAEDLAGLLRRDPARIAVVPNPVVTPHLAALSREPVPGPLPAGEGPLLVSAGRLIPSKDFATLIRAVAHLRETVPARLVILGEGPERPALERLVDDLGLSRHVLLPGFAQNPYAWFAGADLFALSSRWEGFALVLVEALACGTRVVSTDCPTGPREVLEGGVLGRLTPVGDARSLADAMADALAAPVPPQPDLARYGDGAVAERYLELLGIT